MPWARSSRRKVSVMGSDASRTAKRPAASREEVMSSTLVEESTRVNVKTFTCKELYNSKMEKQAIDSREMTRDKAKMKSTIDYLDEAKNRLKIDSDNKMAGILNIKREGISNYRAGRSRMDDYVAARIAEILDIPKIEVIGTANYEREKNQTKREYWKIVVEKERKEKK